MCIACEMGFWMAMEEPPAATPKRKPRKTAAPEVEVFACDAPETVKPVKRRGAAKPRRVTRTKSERRP